MTILRLDAASQPDEDPAVALEREERAAGFSIEDRYGLEWYARAVGRIDAEIAVVRAQAEAMVRDLTRQRESLEWQYGAQVVETLRAELERARGNARHIKTLWGNLGFKTKPARVQISDHAHALEWARANAPDLLETSVNRIALTRRFEPSADGAALVNRETGETLELPGVRVTPSEERFYLSTPKTAATDPEALE